MVRYVHEVVVAVKFERETAAGAGIASERAGVCSHSHSYGGRGRQAARVVDRIGKVRIATEPASRCENEGRRVGLRYGSPGGRLGEGGEGNRRSIRIAVIVEQFGGDGDAARLTRIHDQSVVARDRCAVLLARERVDRIGNAIAVTVSLGRIREEPEFEEVREVCARAVVIPEAVSAEMDGVLVVRVVRFARPEAQQRHRLTGDPGKLPFDKLIRETDPSAARRRIREHEFEAGLLGSTGDREQVATAGLGVGFRLRPRKGAGRQPTGGPPQSRNRRSMYLHRYQQGAGCA